MRMEASGDAASTVFERAAVMPAKVTVIAYGHAVRDVSVAAEKHGSTVPGRRPRAEAPAKPGIDPDRDSRIEAQPYSPHHACGRRQNDEARIGNKQRAPDGPWIVIRNKNHGRVNRHDLDQAGFYHDALLRRRHQYLRILRLQPHRLNGVHDVAGLVVIGVAKLRRPGAVFRQIVERGGEFDKTLNGRVPIHGIRPCGALIRGQIHVLVEPGIGRGDLARIGGGSQNLSHQRVRIEGDRGHELIQLYRVQIDVRSRGRLGVQIRLRCRNQQQGKYERHH
jgi:hypothetical protein